ncbi:MAG TPA: aldo/keto reductase [Candidatus Limnocylindrales bacterium]
MAEPFVPAPGRYGDMTYRRAGRSGLQLPVVSLGLWHNFGDETPFETQRAVWRRAFDLGVVHFDLANNYGVPAGSAETNVGGALATDLAPYRDELVISSKAGWDMWPGPYGEYNGRKHLLASLDQSLRRLGLEYVDIFYSHRPDPGTPLEETMGALDTAVRSGRALYAGISSYEPGMTRDAVAIMRALGTPLLVHQPSYSMLDRWVEDELLEVLDEAGMGCVVFSPLAQGQLSDRYLAGIPAGSRATWSRFLDADEVEANLPAVRRLAEVAAGRGQPLAEMALSWILRDPRITTVLAGASAVGQLEANVRAASAPGFAADELARIDEILATGA